MHESDVRILMKLKSQSEENGSSKTINSRSVHSKFNFDPSPVYPQNLLNFNKLTPLVYNLSSKNLFR